VKKGKGTNQEKKERTEKQRRKKPVRAASPGGDDR